MTAAVLAASATAAATQVLFDAVIVTRASAEGRIMKKWLDAARRKMGGLHLFPKDGAKYVLQIQTSSSI
jgi:hypothetical protein